MNWLITTALILVSSACFAEEIKSQPCKAIKTACEAAGYVKGGHKKGQNKGLIKDCLKPIMSGAAVAGVSVNPADVQACQAKRAKKHK